MYENVLNFQKIYFLHIMTLCVTSNKFINNSVVLQFT